MQLECDSQITILKMYDGKLTVQAIDIQRHRRSSWSRFHCGFLILYSNNNFIKCTSIFTLPEYKQTIVCLELHRRCHNNQLTNTTHQ